MKRKIGMLCVIVFGLMVTGCTKSIELTTEQNGMIANYIAHTVVKITRRDYTYVPEIKEGSIWDEFETESSEPETDENGNIVKHDYSGLEQFLGMDNIEISYKGCTITDEYSNDNLFYWTADPGKKLIIIEYNLHNFGEEEINYSVPFETVMFKLVLSNDKRIISHENLLKNNIVSMKNFAIKPNEDRTGIIGFMVDENDLQYFINVNLQYGRDNNYFELPTEVR